MSKACFSGSSSEALPSAALIPPSAAPEWLRTGWIFEMSATSAPWSWASIAARMPAQPAPTIRTSCLASTKIGRYPIETGKGVRRAGPAETMFSSAPNFSKFSLKRCAR